MFTRFPIAACVLVASAFAFGCAQTPPPPKAQANKPSKPAPIIVKLPPILPNPKWSLSQNSAQLLLNNGVQADLDLSKETKKALLAVYADYDAKYNELTKGQTATDALEAKLDDLMSESANKAIALLSPAQVTRLNQLGVQAMELEALRLPDVRAKLALTPDQTAQFDKAFTDLDTKQDAFDSELGERISKLTDPGANATQDERAAYNQKQKAILDDMEPRSKALEEQRKSDLPALLAILTPDQKATWQTLTGPPLKGS